MTTSEIQGESMWPQMHREIAEHRPIDPVFKPVCDVGREFSNDSSSLHIEETLNSLAVFSCSR